MNGLLWLLVIVCSIDSVLPRCDNFVNGGIPETVVIPEGEGTELFCQYSDPGGIPRVVGWFRDSTMIVGDGMQEQCDCASVRSGRANNLTFSNFMSERSANEYGCWATVPDGFDECNFNVVVAEPPVIMLDQADVSGNQLGASLTISPTITLGLPLADVTWARSNQGNDQVLDRNDPRVTISSGGVLTVTDVVASDRGEYTVTASNIAAPSGVTASVQVFIEFLEIDGPTFTNTADGNFQVDCRVTGYPAPVTVTLSPDTGSSGSSSRTPAGDPFQMIREVDLTFPTCNSATTFICMATAGSSQSKNMRATPVCSTPTPTSSPSPLESPTNVMTHRISATEAIVFWDPPAGASNIGGYRVRYNEQEVVSFSTSVVLRDLVDGVTYRITVAAFRSQGDRPEDLLFSMELLFPCDDIPPLEAAITGTRVFLNDVNGQRTLTVNWMDSTEDGVVKYRVFVTPTGTRPPFQADTMDSGLTQYNLSPDLCDGSTYWFTVAAVDRCERQGPIGQPVSINCTTVTRSTKPGLTNTATLPSMTDTSTTTLYYIIGGLSAIILTGIFLTVMFLMTCYCHRKQNTSNSAQLAQLPLDPMYESVNSPTRETDLKFYLENAACVIDKTNQVQCSANPAYETRPVHTSANPAYETRPVRTSNNPAYETRPVHTSDNPAYETRPVHTSDNPAYETRPVHTTDNPAYPMRTSDNQASCLMLAVHTSDNPAYEKSVAAEKPIMKLLYSDV